MPPCPRTRAPFWCPELNPLPCMTSPANHGSPKCRPWWMAHPGSRQREVDVVLLVATRTELEAAPSPPLSLRRCGRFLGDAIQIRVAYSRDRPVAAILTLRYNRTMIYKYGASDPETTNMGGTPLLFWRTIQESHQLGLETFDLGRSDLEGEGPAGIQKPVGHRGIEAFLSPKYRPSSGTVPPGERTGALSPRRMARVAMTKLPLPVFTRLGKWASRHVG